MAKKTKHKERTNADRADGMREALIKLYGVNEVQVDPQSCLIDALTDLRHWWKSAYPSDVTDAMSCHVFTKAVTTSEGHFLSEQRGDTE